MYVNQNVNPVRTFRISNRPVETKINEPFEQPPPQIENIEIRGKNPGDVAGVLG